jgi:uncharacterized protein YndB with AHSA1/START domain
MEIIVQVLISAHLDKVWKAYTTPYDIKIWNAASDDWHTTESKVDLRVGGTFSSRMEAKDGSFGFDFAGIYTNVVNHELIEYSFGERTARVEFSKQHGGVLVRVVFDPETQHPIEQQQQGWQAILNRFKNYVESSNQ